MTRKTFTGIARRRTTRASVKVADATARTLITIGGIGTILAVILILVFLVWVVVPLFEAVELSDPSSTPLSGDSVARETLRVAVDEHRLLTWRLLEDGVLVVARLDTGEVLSEAHLFDRSWVGEDGTDDEVEALSGTVPTAVSFSVTGREVCLGFDDGTVVLGKIGFRAEFFEEGVVPPEVRQLGIDEFTVWKGGMVQKTPEGQFRLKRVECSFEPPTRIEPAAAIRALDMSVTATGQVVAAVTGDGRVIVKEVQRRRNLMTGKTRLVLTGGEFRIGEEDHDDLPDWVLLAERGTFLYAVWASGDLVRFNVRDRTKPVRVERIDIVSEKDVKLTAMCFLNGKTTLLAGDSTGRLRAWFPILPDEPETVDGAELAMGHEFPAQGSPVTAIGVSMRVRMAAVGFADGTLRVYHITGEDLLSEHRVEGNEGFRALCINPRDDGITGVLSGRLWRCRMDAQHPDITLGILFTKIWYEGYKGPKHEWQSTGSTDDYEPKLGLMVLIFGTVKATVYSMLFGLPIALLAAIFTSEFLQPRIRSKIKPTIEVMASLPSVVLGFLAALVIAPFVDRIVPTVLTSFATIPFAFLLGAYLWQLLPNRTAILRQGWRFPLICLCVPFGLLLAALLGPSVERWLFAGDIKLWLDGQAGSGWGGWMIFLLPAAALLVGILIYWVFGPHFRRLTRGLGRSECAGFDLVRFAAAAVCTVLVGLILSHLADFVFGDPRGEVLGTYVPRNALIVGFVMGFAIIPIIYTIAEDALSAVPEHLRSASLGAGATPWQTATRIIVPTAMSGLFSATMIGLGRAVGETMIVLMATGNTPIMDWNMFNGLRTLSANLAVELPEAVKDSSHYRTLFLAALVLFIMTFILNTVAEAVRIRFRKRAFEL